MSTDIIGNVSKLDERLKITQQIARQAGEIALTHFQNIEKLNIELKGKQDYVSNADREVEDFIRSRMAETFPEDGFLGEESGGELAPSLWVVDPIDGTTNFLRGIPMFGISIAWSFENKTRLGVIYEPATNRMFSAHELCEAQCNGKAIKIRNGQTLEQSIVGVGYAQRNGYEPFIRRLHNVLKTGSEFRRLGAATIGLVYAASGQTDAFYQAHLSPWDVLAGLHIAERAGATVGDFYANDGLKNGNVAFCASPSIAKDLAKHLEVHVDLI